MPRTKKSASKAMVPKPNQAQALSKSTQQVVRAAQKARFDRVPQFRESIPRLIMDMMIPAEVLAYSLCLAFPEEFHCRLPDEYPVLTALYPSCQEFEIPLSSSTLADAGRFALAALPTIGTASPATNVGWQTYVVSDAVQDYAGQDWSLTTAYANQVSGQKLYQDLEFTDLAFGHYEGPDAFLYDTTANTVLALDTMATWASSMQTLVFGSTTPLISSFVPSIDSSAVMTLPSRANTTTYRIDYMERTTIPASNTVHRYTMSTSVTGVTVTAYHELGNVVAGTAEVVYSSWAVEVEGGVVSPTVQFSVVNTGGSYAGVTSLQVVFGLEPISDQATLGFGLMSEYRPVAMSVLASYFGEQLHDAGMISCALGPRGSFSENWLTSGNPPSGFRPQDWTTYKRLEAGNSSAVLHSSRLNTGCYVNWRPTDKNDTVFYELNDAKTKEWPTIFVAGQYPYVGGATAPIEVVRIRTCRLFEYPSVSQLISREKVDRTLVNIVPMALAVLERTGVPICTTNALHVILPAILAAWGPKLLAGLAAIKGFFVKGAIAAGAIAAATGTSASYNSKDGLTVKTGWSTPTLTASPAAAASAVKL